MRTRSKFLSFTTTLLLLASLMAGCGSNVPESSVQATAGTETKTAQETSEAGGMRTYKMVNGKEIQIPATPKRIVSDLYLGELLAVGAKPVGIHPYELKNPFLTKEQLAEIEEIGDPISLEKITALNPDLIIISDEELYEQVSKIASTVLIPYGTYNDDVHVDMRAFGELLGKQEAAEAWIKQFDEKSANARDKVKEVVKEGETVGIYELRSQEFYVLGENWGRGGQVIYNALKLTPPTAVKEVVDANTPPKLVSLEVLPEFAADHMFVTTYETGKEDMDKFFQSSIYQNLPAVKNNHVYNMTFDQMYYYDPIAIEGQLDLMVEQLVTH
ncbi:iron-hydroxamate ABC transporter substrate-binding protein [Brevibacillus sp. SIMBA_040]|uniref:iron-hydroxamate ABC transporter substrate-binding protein n=2 Tax=Bacillales TaxID=1385 RepID=UPI00397970BD